MSKKNRTIFTRALSLGRALCVCGALFTVMGWGFQADAGTGMNGEMTAEERRIQVKASCERLRAEFEHPATAAVLAKAEAR